MDDRIWSSQVKKGVTELIVLAALQSGEAYGYELLQTLSRSPLLATTESTLYPLLARLSDERLIAVRHAASPSGPPRRYYRLTARGTAHLQSLLAHWRNLNREIETLF